MTTLDRRSLLAGATGTAFVAALPASAAAPTAAGALVDALDQRDSALAIGREVLAQQPGLSADVLVAELARAVALPPGRLARMDRELLRARLDAARSAEFGRADTVRVRGWVLAASEARLCALVALA
ncbi:MAG TPA: hypothetical protein PKA13_08175 [Geminicoccaceae bacterium]|nr:hypothetical protein [Geminicoccus sp.]HMU49738.1 hypothetical protein [Geminicoccaceae bacterium]